MRNFQIVYPLSFLLLAALVYILVLGDSGYLMKSRLKEQLSELEQNVEQLQEENGVLQVRYDSESRPFTQETTILKVEGLERNGRLFWQAANQDQEISFTEARILYFIIMSTLGLLGYYLAGVFFRERER